MAREVVRETPCKRIAPIFLYNLLSFRKFETEHFILCSFSVSELAQRCGTSRHCVLYLLGEFTMEGYVIPLQRFRYPEDWRFRYYVAVMKYVLEPKPACFFRNVSIALVKLAKWILETKPINKAGHVRGKTRDLGEKLGVGAWNVGMAVKLGPELHLWEIVRFRDGRFVIAPNRYKVQKMVEATEKLTGYWRFFQLA